MLKAASSSHKFLLVKSLNFTESSCPLEEDQKAKIIVFRDPFSKFISGFKEESSRGERHMSDPTQIGGFSNATCHFFQERLFGWG